MNRNKQDMALKNIHSIVKFPTISKICLEQSFLTFRTFGSFHSGTAVIEKIYRMFSYSFWLQFLMSFALCIPSSPCQRVLLPQGCPRVLLTDCSNGSWRCKQGSYSMLREHTEISTSIWCSHRLPLQGDSFKMSLGKMSHISLTVQYLHI